MKKQIKEILTRSQISAKWCNMGTWTKEDYENLQEAVEDKSINIREDKSRLDICGLKLTMKLGRMQIHLESSLIDLERDIITLLKMDAQFLGDKTTISSRFGTDKINF